MDKQTLSNYGWIVICVLVMAVMLAFASPFGNFVAGAIQSTTQGLFDVNNEALDSAHMEKLQNEWEMTFLDSPSVNTPVKFGQPYQITMDGMVYEYVFYADGSATFWIADAIAQSVPAGSFTYTETEVIMEEDPISISADGTTLYDPNDESFVMTLKPVTTGPIKTGNYVLDPNGLIGITGITVTVGTDGSITIYENGAAGETIPASAIQWYENYYTVDGETFGVIYPDGSKFTVGEYVCANVGSYVCPIQFEKHYSIEDDGDEISWVFHEDGSYNICLNGNSLTLMPAGSATYFGTKVTFTQDPLLGQIQGTLSSDGSKITINNNGNELVLSLSTTNTITITADNRHLIGYTGEENEHLVIPDTVIGSDGTIYNKIIIGYEAFMNCQNLVSITLSDSVTYLDTRAFYRCNNVKEINLGNGLKRMYNYALASTAIKTITIPDNVTNIGAYALECDDLETVYIGKGLQGISAYAFYLDNKLTAIEVDPNNPTFCDVDGVLYTKDMTRLIKYPSAKTDTRFVIPNTVTEIGGGGAIHSCDYLHEVVIPNSVTRIGQWEFSGCDNLTSITIPSSVTYISSDAIYSLKNLQEIIVDANNPKYCSVDGILYTKDMTTLLKCPDGKNIGSYIVPEGVKKLEEAVFHNNKSITSLTLPSSLTTIEWGVCTYCFNLSEIIFNGTVEQWNSITASATWNLNAPAKQVICSDGTVTLK